MAAKAAVEEKKTEKATLRGQSRNDKGAEKKVADEAKVKKKALKDAKEAGLQKAIATNAVDGRNKNWQKISTTAMGMYSDEKVRADDLEALNRSLMAQLAAANNPAPNNPPPPPPDLV